ncbi:RNA polymerase sigma factor [Paenibacillus sp. sptzw28]|uniref:RNA polymerase sigma factor n=1 Tax=Paenibacillus sp. sptzw28 TaxID=715179 RepID=UPI001C6EC08D|nr:RNA polymerase sigma factor [Paenibacillus sp. sptzw28]QYR21114.1 RNA polymerase sigma factor [Paenibacillus sp. sptzw28]
MEQTAKLDWHNIWNTHKKELFRYIVRITENYIDAEDILQDTFVKGYLYLELNKGELKTDSIIPLFKRIAKNVYYDYCRKRKRELLSNPFVTDNCNIEEKSLAKLELNRILSSLLFNEQKVVTYRLIYGYSIRDTAAILNKTEGSVKLTYFRAIKRIKKYAN